MEKIIFRLAKSEDIPQMVEFLKLLFTEEEEFTPDYEKQTKGLSLIIENPIMGEIIVAEHGDKVVGMVNLLYTISTAEGGKVAILEDLVVNPDYRSVGIGSSILNQAIEYCENQGLKRITLLTDEDPKVMTFYKRHGFKKSPMIPLRMIF
ncbi:MAG: GNAT family N-acetyltransferase [Cytophagales bacterium]